jgi:hypothetical protein
MFPVSCLDLSASIGNSDSGSSLQVAYGAETVDSIYQEIEMDANKGTISNQFSGSGSLPYSSLGKSDARGNFVRVYRSISGKPGVTKWSYEWKTFSLVSSSAGYGVGAQLWLNANNAYAISCGSSSSSNRAGNAVADTKIVSSLGPTSSITNYYASSTAFSGECDVYQCVSAARGESIQVVSKAYDTGGSAIAAILCNTDSSIGSSSLDNSCSSAIKTKTGAKAKLKFNSASGLSLNSYLSASNPSGDEAHGNLNRYQTDKNIATFSSFCGSSEYTNSYARTDISNLKVNLPVGSVMSVCIASSTTLSAGLVGKCSVSTSFVGKTNLYKYPYSKSDWKSYSFASKSSGLIRAQQSSYGKSSQYKSGQSIRNSYFAFNSEASKSGYATAGKKVVAYNKAAKMYSCAQVTISGAPYVSHGCLA